MASTMHTFRTCDGSHCKTLHCISLFDIQPLLYSRPSLFDFYQTCSHILNYHCQSLESTDCFTILHQQYQLYNRWLLLNISKCFDWIRIFGLITDTWTCWKCYECHKSDIDLVMSVSIMEYFILVWGWLFTFVKPFLLLDLLIVQFTS